MDARCSSSMQWWYPVALPPMRSAWATRVICGCESFTEMREFGECKLEFFESLLSLENGIPSHDTFGRVFAAIPPAESHGHRLPFGPNGATRDRGTRRTGKASATQDLLASGTWRK